MSDWSNSQHDGQPLAPPGAAGDLQDQADGFSDPTGKGSLHFPHLHNQSGNEPILKQNEPPPTDVLSVENGYWPLSAQAAPRR